MVLWIKVNVFINNLIILVKVINVNQYNDQKSDAQTNEEKKPSDKNIETNSSIQNKGMVYKIKTIEKILPKEYGLKYNGPEPTRYGDWVINGKCVDFWMQKYKFLVIINMLFSINSLNNLN